MADEQRAENHRVQFILDEEPFDLGVKVKVVGIGDTAGSVFAHLRRSPIKRAELILVDADGSRSQNSPLTRGNDARGSHAHDHARHEIDQVAALIEGANLVVIVTCLEGVATEAAQTVAALSNETKALTIAVVATPLDCTEQPARERAEAELSALEDAVDGLIYVPMSDYQRLAPHAETPAAIQEGVTFSLAQAVRALVRPLTDQESNIFCVDPGDFRRLFEQYGRGAFAVGSGYGEQRSTDSVLAAVGEEGLLVGGARLSEAKGVWLVIEGGDSLMLYEVNQAVTRIQNGVADDTPVIFSTFVVPEMGMEMRATILTTGHESYGFQSPPNYHARTDGARVSAAWLK